MTTALQLVNRVRRRLREEDVSAFGDDLTTHVLDHLNEAKRDILESYTWDFDLRTDGELVTVPALAAQSVGMNNQSQSVFSTIPVASLGIGSFAVARLVVTSDDTYGDTALRIASITPPGILTLLNLQSYWPGPTDGTATGTIVFDEYVLPETVRAVTSVRHQESDLQVIETDRDIGMDAWAVRPHANQGETPERVFVGKRVRATYSTADATSDLSGIGIKFDPTPGTTALVFSYSYVYRHPDLSDTQDLDGVDPSVEDLIVRLSEARAMLSGLGGGDVELGAAMETEVMNRAAALKGNSRRDPMRRYVLGPTIAGSRSRYGFGRFPRNFGSI